MNPLIIFCIALCAVIALVATNKKWRERLAESRRWRKIDRELAKAHRRADALLSHQSGHSVNHLLSPQSYRSKI